MSRRIAHVFLWAATLGLLSSCATQRHRPIRVACVGDSITYGYGFKDRDHESYPAQLAVLLGDKWEVRNFGVNGATLLKEGTRPYFLKQAYRDALGFKPNVVIIKLGTNDTKPENWGTHQTNFVSDYIELIESFSNLETKPRIYLCRPVPIFRNRGKIPDPYEVLKEIIPAIDEVARKADLPVIDLFVEFENRAELFPDGVHPTAEGANIIAHKVYSTLTGQKAKRTASR